MAIKPTKPVSPPQALRSNPESFSARAEGWIAYQATTFPNYIDDVVDFVDEKAEEALAAALGGDLPPLTGQGGKLLAVKDDETGAEFVDDPIGALGSNGFVARTGAGTAAARTLTAGTGISITNGDGAAGNPTISVTSGASSITLGTAVASTSGTAIDFTGIPSTAKRVTVMLSGVSFNGNPLSLLLRLGTSAGFDTTSDYDTSASNISSAVATSSAIDSIFYVTGSATFGATTIFSGAIVLSKVSGNTWVLSGSLVSLNVASATIVSSGRKALSADLDRVRIFPNAGGVNFDAGTINISWEF